MLRARASLSLPFRYFDTLHAIVGNSIVVCETWVHFSTMETSTSTDFNPGALKFPADNGAMVESFDSIGRRDLEIL